MNFQQLRSAREAARRDYNLTQVARALQTSQPGVSRQIRELEDEIGTPLFVRAGRRLTGLTVPGERLLPIVERILEHEAHLRRIGQDAARDEEGPLRIATTHSQARYALPPAVLAFRRDCPQVTLQLQQGTPEQVARWLMRGEADIGLASEALDLHPELISQPCHEWSHVVLVPRDHPLDDGQPLTLARLATHPLVSYEVGFTGRQGIDRAFAEAGLQPRWVLEAMDADVIKTYVGMGLGVGIVAGIAYQPERDTALVALPARHLFGFNVTRMAVRAGTELRPHHRAFIRAFAPALPQDAFDPAGR